MSNDAGVQARKRLLGTLQIPKDPEINFHQPDLDFKKEIHSIAVEHMSRNAHRGVKGGKSLLSTILKHFEDMKYEFVAWVPDDTSEDDGSWVPITKSTTIKDLIRNKAKPIRKSLEDYRFGVQCRHFDAGFGENFIPMEMDKTDVSNKAVEWLKRILHDNKNTYGTGEDHKTRVTIMEQAKKEGFHFLKWSNATVCWEELDWNQKDEVGKIQDFLIKCSWTMKGLDVAEFIPFDGLAPPSPAQLLKEYAAIQEKLAGLTAEIVDLNKQLTSTKLGPKTSQNAAKSKARAAKQMDQKGSEVSTMSARLVQILKALEGTKK